MGVAILAQKIDHFVKEFGEEFPDLVLFGLFMRINDKKFIAVQSSRFGLLNAERSEIRVEFLASDLQKFEFVDLFVEFCDGLVFIF